MLRHPLSTPTAHFLVPEGWRLELSPPGRVEHIYLGSLNTQLMSHLDHSQ